MSTLNFPTNPTLNQQYSFGGKTWIWTGQAWRLDPQGAINGIVIGNIAPAAGTFTTLTANTLTVNNETIYANLSVGNLAVSNVSISGNVNSALNVRGNVTGTNVITGGTVSAAGSIDTLGNVSALGNVAGNYYTGNGRFLTGVVATGSNAIALGSSNVSIPDANSNVTVSVDGVSNVAVFTTTGLNVAGTLVAGNIVGNVTGNLNVTGNTGDVLFNANGVVGATDAFKFDSANTVLAVAGNVVANVFVGDGRALANVVAARGTDSNNWNTLIQMGVYTVNRVSWSGTVGTPLDSQVFVGLLEVLNDNSTAITQIFLPWHSRCW